MLVVRSSCRSSNNDKDDDVAFDGCDDDVDNDNDYDCDDYDDGDDDDDNDVDDVKLRLSQQYIRCIPLHFLSSIFMLDTHYMNAHKYIHIYDLLD